MRNALIALALLAWLPTFWYPAWGQVQGIRNGAAQKRKQDANLTAPQPQVGTGAAPLIVETHPRAKSEREAAEAKADEDYAARINGCTLIFTGAAALFTGLLVWIGGCGVRAANRTLLAIEKQTKAIETQARLMEEDCRISNRAYLSLGEKLEKPIGARACFPIENTGRVPGHLKSAEIEIIGRLSGIHRTWTSSVTLSDTIVPGKHNAFELCITLPSEALDDAEGVLVTADVIYETGFSRETDTFRFIRVLKTDAQEWVVASLFTDVDALKEDTADQYQRGGNPI